MDKDYNIKGIIEYHIVKSGKTKKQIAEAAKMNPGSFNKMLSNPTAKTMKSLADALGIKPYELLQTEKDMQVEGKTEPSNEVLCPHCGKPIKITLE